MALRIKSVTVDCADPYALALFWGEVSGFGEGPENGNAPEDEEALLIAPDGSAELLFIRVPEGKTVKNRIHLDLEPTDRRRDEEVERVVALGATVIDDQRNADGSGWVVLADPESNEFCILRSVAERAER